MQVTRPNVTAAIIAFAVFAVLLCACDKPLDHWTETGPKMANTQAVVRAVETVAPCDVTPWGGQIAVQDSYQNPPECPLPAAGCYYNSEPPIVIVRYAPDAWDSALAHELCHAADDKCGLPIYEAKAEDCDRASRVYR